MTSTVRLTVPNFIHESVVDGLGFRLYIGFQSCRHNCKGCFNPSAHSFVGGELKSLDYVKQEIAKACKYHEGVTFSGGDSLEQPEQLRILSEYAHSLNLDTWLYTGYTWEQIMSDRIKFNAIQHIDVIVDGKFIESLKGEYGFKGSANQRIINVKESLKTGILHVLDL